MESAFLQAESFAGKYAIVDGTTADGTRYTGEVEFAPHGLFSHLRAKLDPIGERFGLAVVFDNRLLVAWGPEKKVESGAYRVAGDRMHGIWIPPDAAGDNLSACGQEKSVRTSEKAWTIEQAFDLEKKPYTGTVEVTPAAGSASQGPAIASILWKLHDGEYNSFGLVGPGWMVSTFNFAPGTPHAVAAYERSPEGWKGVQVWKGDAALSREQFVHQ